MPPVNAPLFEDVQMRDVIERDIAQFHEFEQDPVANQLAVFPAREWEEFERHWLKILADDRVGKQTIVVGNQVVGNVVSWDHAGSRMIGYWIDRAYWGRGIATSSLTRFLTMERQRPLYAQVAEGNIGSRRVLAKCGFVELRTEWLTFANSGHDFNEVTLVLSAADGAAN